MRKLQGCETCARYVRLDVPRSMRKPLQMGRVLRELQSCALWSIAVQCMSGLIIVVAKAAVSVELLSLSARARSQQLHSFFIAQ